MKSSDDYIMVKLYFLDQGKMVWKKIRRSQWSDPSGVWEKKGWVKDA